MHPDRKMLSLPITEVESWTEITKAEVEIPIPIPAPNDAQFARL